MTRASFDLDGDKPTVTVAAGYSKHRRQDVLPIRSDTAADLRGLLAAKIPGVPAFAIPKDRHNSAGMFQADPAAARAAWLKDAPTPQDRQDREKTSFLDYADSAGQVADFHGLRHTCGSLLAASGTHPKVAQSIMRHSTIDLTMSRYSHVFAGQEADALAALPDLGARPAKQSARATGTDNARADKNAPRCPTLNDRRQGRLEWDRPKCNAAPVADLISATRRDEKTGDSRLALCLALSGEKERSLANRGELKDEKVESEENPCEIELSPISSGSELALAGVAELADAQDSKS